MTDEIKERPDRATGPREVWEREDGWLCTMYLTCHGSKCYRTIGGDNNCWGYVDELQPDRYRIRTLDEKPWPPKTRIEKRRVVLAYDPDSCTEKVFYLRDHENITARFTIRLDEIRDCEIREDGKVIRVLKEGE